MEIPVTFIDEPTTRGSLVLGNKIGEGKFDVYEVFSSLDSTKYALKIFPKDQHAISHYMKEKLTFYLNHSNIIKQVPIICHRNDFSVLLFEFASYGDFYEIVTKNILNKEILARTYFQQLIKGIEYLHSQGLAHLDLKLDNLMLGSDFLLKIIDFDHAQNISDKTANTVGSKAYRAPEIRNLTCNNLRAADVYSAGVILFAFMAVKFPFLENEDPEGKDVRCYSTYVKDKKAFWALQNKTSYFGQDFIDLIDGMVHEDQNKRFTIKDIKGSKWYNGPALDIKSLKNEMEMRMGTIKRKI